MKAFLAISILFLCTVAQAGDFPNYFFCRGWVERECATNTIPQGDRLFVGSFITKPYFATIIRFHEGLTLRQIIDQTPLKRKTVLACVMWPDKTTTMPFTRSFDVTVGPMDRPNFVLHKLNVIWLLDDGPIINTSRSNKGYAAFETTLGVSAKIVSASSLVVSAR